MDADYSDYRLDPFVPDSREGIEEEDAFTSNEMRTLADKIEAFISGAELIMRVPNEASDLSARQANDNLERLCYGILRNADRRLHRAGQPAIIPSLAWFSTVRGGFVALRAFLRKDVYGQTVEDILPLDPRHLVIEWGTDGIHCSGYRLEKTRRQIETDYEYKFDDDKDKTEVEIIYDYYYMEKGLVYNGVLMMDTWIKKPSLLYGVLSFPVIAIPVGSQPRLAPIAEGSNSRESPSHTIRDFGESVFASNRDIVRIYNRVMTYAVSQTAQASDPAFTVESLDGTKSVDSTPFAKGAQTNTSSANQEKIVPLSTPDLRRDTQALLGAVKQGITQGALPEQAYGILPAPISSLALRQLGNNLEQKVFPRLRAVQASLQYALENMIDQFETGAYEPIRVKGRSWDKVPISGPIAPEDIIDHGEIEVTLEPHFPEDEQARWQVANLAMQPTQSGEPLASLRYTRSRILKIADSDLMQNENMEQMARISDPIASAYQMYLAAKRAGDKALAIRWLDKMKMTEIMEFVQVNQASMGLVQALMGGPTSMAPQPQPPGQGTPPNPNGLPPTIAPTANATPSPEAGYNTTAPRLGGRTPENQQLAAAGM